MVNNKITGLGCMRNLLFLCFSIVIPIQLLFAQEADDYYVSKKLNDTVVVYGETKYQSHIYFFIDEVSCFTCVESIKNILPVISKYKRVNIVFFIRASTKNRFDNIVKQYNIPKQTVIHDIVGAYQMLYGVKQFPVMMLLASNGIIQYIGIPGKAHFDIQKITSVLQLSTHAPLSASIKPLTKHKILATSNGYPLKKDHVVTCTFSAQDNKLYLWKFNSHILYIIGIHGEIEDSFSMDDDYSSLFSGTNVPVMGNGNIHSRNIPFSILNINGHSTLMSFNSRTKRFTEIAVLKEDDYTYPFFPITVINDTTYVSALRYKERNFPQAWQKTPSFRVIKNGITTSYGMLDEIVIQYPISRFYNQALSTDGKGNLLEIGSFSEKLRTYSVNGELLHTLKCSYDPKYWNYNWKLYFSKLNIDSPVHHFMNLQDSVTKIAESDGILVDELNGRFAVVYQKNSVNSSNNHYVRYFVHFPNNTLADIALPNDAKPFRFDNGILYCIESENEELYITSYLCK